jgi:hypothetical protein
MNPGYWPRGRPRQPWRTVRDLPEGGAVIAHVETGERRHLIYDPVRDVYISHPEAPSCCDYS